MDDKQAHEKRLTPLGIRVKQIKTAMKHHFTLTRVAVIKKKKKKNRQLPALTRNWGNSHVVQVGL